MINNMTNKQHASGFTLIELIIGLVIVIALSTTAVSIYYHSFHIESVSTKISDSIKRIKNAATIYCFYNRHNPSAQPLTFDVLINNHYLNPNSIYRGAKHGKKAKLKFDYNYNVTYKPAPVNHTIITIDLITDQHIRLNQAHPNVVPNKQSQAGDYDYQWSFMPILPAGQEANVAQSEYLNRLTTGKTI